MTEHTNPDDTELRTLRKVVFSAGNEYDPNNNGVVVDLDEANIICSDALGWSEWHYPVIDIDFPIKAIPSSTPGHFHLYIDMPIPWEKYMTILEAMADAGIVQPGYVAASIRRGHTDVRLPWCAK